MRLAVKASPEEELLFHLLGIDAWQDGKQAVFAGKDEAELLDDVDIVGVILPDIKDVEAQTRRLARRLARAVGVGEFSY